MISYHITSYPIRVRLAEHFEAVRLQHLKNIYIYIYIYIYV